MEENTNITNVEEIVETVEVKPEPEVLEDTENETTEVDVTTGVIVSAVALVALAGAHEEAASGGTQTDNSPAES